MSTLGLQAKLELGKAADKSQSQQPAVQGGSFDGLQHRLLLPAWLVIGFSVSYTHLTLPTNREV